MNFKLLSLRIFLILILTSCGVEGPPIPPDGRNLEPIEYKYTHIPGTCDDEISRKNDPVCESIREKREQALIEKEKNLLKINNQSPEEAKE